MDIFNVAAKQLDNAMNANQSFATQHRTVENTEIASHTKQNNTEQDKKEIEKKLTDVTKHLNDQMSELNTDIRFGYNDKISSMYVDVTERHTGKLIRQIPTKEAMRLSEYFKEAIGILFDKKG